MRKWSGLAARAFSLLLVIQAASLRAQELGSPFIRNFTPKEYGADSQNWAVVQGPRGVVYAGNNQGILAYDGVRWRLIRTPGRSTVRSLAEDTDGRVFVGAVGEIGYLAPDSGGRMAFVSLADKLPPDARTFSDVWATRATSRGILFQTREELMLYDGQHFQVWKATTTFHVAFSVGDRIFVRQRETGLEELVGGRLQLLPGGERFAHESVFAMLPSKGSILVASRNLGLWRLTEKGLEAFPTEADAFLKAAALYGGTLLPDGTFALATIQGGVIVMDGEGRVRLVLDQASGLQGDNVKAVFPDGHGSLWLALDNGLARVEWPSPFTTMDERNGLKGTVWSMARHQGRLFVATGQGAYVLEAASSPGGRPAFHPIADTQTQSLAFLEVDGHLLLANSRGVFEIQGDAAVPVRPSSNVAISLLRSKRDPSRVFVGLQGGLASMRWANGRWLDEGLVPGVKDDIYSMAEDGQGRLWLGTGAQGVLRATFLPGWSGGAAGPPPQVDHFGEGQGLPLNQVMVLDAPGGILFATHGGFLRFQEASGLFSPDPRFGGLFPDGARWVKAVALDSRGRIWLDSINEASGLHETGAAVPQPDGFYLWDPTLLRRVSDTAIESILPDQDGILWFGGPDGIIRYDAAVPRSPLPPFPVLIRNIEMKEGGTLSPTLQDTRLPYARNALRFDFAAPGLDQSSGTQYQVVLEGYDHEWGPWSMETRKEYTNLHEGSYRFRVRARNVYGRETGEAVFAFRVLPPWYRAWWAWLLWIACAGGALAAGIGVRTRMLRQRNARLEAKVAEATEELREREQLLAHQAADLENANLALHALNEQKDQYLGLVVHDLRNPLNTILLTAESIMEESREPDVKGLAGQVARTAEEMGGLIGRFLDIAAIDAGMVQARLESFPMEILVREAAEAIGAQAALKSIQVRTLLSETSSPARVDPAFAKEILANLLSNALKFSPPGTTVTLRLQTQGHAVLVSVEDQGPGLTEEDKRRIFGRFARLTAQPTGGETSVGLGLSIVKHMVEACGGRIWVESAEGEGAAFHVAFVKAEEGVSEGR
jgi:signal transduction histidine kinase